MESAALVVGAIILFGFIFLMRLLGAWMLRINDVITELRAIKEILKVNLTEEERQRIIKSLQK